MSSPAQSFSLVMKSLSLSQLPEANMVIVQTEDFDSASLIARLHAQTAGRAGALVSFTGYVRDYASNQETRTLFLEHYPGMCEREIADICHHAQTRWNTAEPMVVH